MRKIMFILTLICSMFIVQNVEAQIYQYRVNQFAIASINQYSGRYTWSEWQRSSVEIYIDFDNDKIYVDSKTPQRFSVITTGDWISDQGGRSISFRVIDQDGDRGTIRLRVENNGNSQLYVDYADISYVYSGLKRLR